MNETNMLVFLLELCGAAFMCALLYAMYRCFTPKRTRIRTYHTRDLLTPDQRKAGPLLSDAEVVALTVEKYGTLTATEGALCSTKCLQFTVRVPTDVL